MGVAIRRYIDILTIIIKFPYSTCISSFFGTSIPTSLFIFKMFFRIYIMCVCSIWSAGAVHVEVEYRVCKHNKCQYTFWCVHSTQSPCVSSFNALRTLCHNQ